MSSRDVLTKNHFVEVMLLLDQNKMKPTNFGWLHFILIQ